MALPMPISNRGSHAKVNVAGSNHNLTIQNLDFEEMGTEGTRYEPRGAIRIGSYHSKAPIIRPSRLTTHELGGVGKELSEGWCLNHAIGCTHGCPFCYVDSIHKRFGPSRYGKIVSEKWGNYLLIPNNLHETIDATPWSRWKGKEVMLSSTHDPYLRELMGATRKILEVALLEGVRFCIQTRSNNIVGDFKLLSEFRSQIRIQVSLATSKRELANLIEPRVPSVQKRMEVLKKAKDNGIDIGVIIAPILPRLNIRPDIETDLRTLTELLVDVAPNHIFAESLHIRGGNYRLLEEVLGEPIPRSSDFDDYVRVLFKQSMDKAGLQAIWWADRPSSRDSRTSARRHHPISKVTGEDILDLDRGVENAKAIRI